MVRDLNFGIDIVVAPIVREKTGLAKSSRNTYLNAAEREMALAISKGLRELKATCRRSDAAPRLSTLEARLKSAGLVVDYVACVDAQTLEPRRRVGKGCCVLVAAYCGKTRLIDNVLI